MTYQLAMAHDHRRSIAEKAIQTFKHHFIAILCGTDEIFPHCTCGAGYLLEQAEHTLNMLRPFKNNTQGISVCIPVRNAQL